MVDGFLSADTARGSAWMRRIVRMIVITGEMQYTFTRGTPFTVGPDRSTWLIFANGAISGSLCGAAYGAITGIALAILVRQPRSAAQL